MLADRVIKFMQEPETDDFERLALEVFEYQFAMNDAYHAYCQARGAPPGKVSRWQDVPAVPTDAFKEAILTCAPPQATFLTTGTTYGAQRRGSHLVPRLDVYRVSALTNFAKHVTPEGRVFPIFVLAPSLAWAPHSSLAQMIAWVAGEMGTSTGHYLDSAGLAADQLRQDLLEASQAGTPVLVVALTRALVELAQRWGWPDRGAISRNRVVLPARSRVMDTGGSKGLGRDVSRTEILAMAEGLLGIDPVYVINEYGMTEMCSQFYDNTLITAASGTRATRCKAVPHWVRTRVVDPLTLSEVEDGARGLLLHFDLANVGSVSAILTEDIGRRIGSGFEVERRVSGAAARGCSLAMGGL